MGFNGSGVFQRVRNWVADATAGIKIRADYHDAEDDGFAAGLTNCITKDGQTVITQNIPFNSKRITGLADPINPQDAATKASVGALTSDKLPLTGGTITGALAVSGDINSGSNINATGYFTASGNIHNSGGGYYMNWPTNSRGVRWDSDQYTFIGDRPVVIGYPSAASHAARVDWVQSNFQPAGSYQANLGFTPVRQGFSGNTVTVGWNGSQLVAQVDATYLGAFAFGSGAQMPYAGDQNDVSGNISEPFNGGICTGVVSARYGDSRVAFVVARFRYLQMIINGSWQTVGYV